MIELQSARTPLPGHCRLHRGLTITELIVVIGIIALLLGLLLPMLRAARTSAHLTVDQNAARHLMLAYATYATVNLDQLLPGHRLGLEATDPGGKPVEPSAAARYPWRIAPYLDYAIRDLFAPGTRDLLENLEVASPGRYRYAVSKYPALGLNSTWLGGDDEDTMFHAQAVYGRYYATHFSRVRRPHQMVTFASTWGVDTLGPPQGTVQGWYVVKSPWDHSRRWEHLPYEPDDPEWWGHLAFRYGYYDAEALVAFLDGHQELRAEDGLDDMRLWAEPADAKEWHP
jgi:type II secretory pathway pseudopilin PulG